MLLGHSPPRDSLLGFNTSPAPSSDGQRVYFAWYPINPTGKGRAVATRRAVVTEIRLADGAERDVLRFDEPSRPHNTASNGIAEYNGWRYFTLSDFQADIWIATVKGLAK